MLDSDEEQTVRAIVDSNEYYIHGNEYYMHGKWALGKNDSMSLLYIDVLCCISMCIFMHFDSWGVMLLKADL